ncbi:MAG: type II restriction endonuclease subunit R [Chloroflexi bacterium CG07_land_8_20_14_0_80_45_17]|nr:MAG: type II restriction endonuclease subunit R [Chloroflexi bacterium CG23_combo_of_CG06-09_8_20_14_all_45_10]PIU56612.1 MAG: type II restriction endonuclease subunit R [Chloroflexi bacterium CG07_land_8_20_14_0_80_45_17]
MARIQRKLPYLFSIAELESSRAGNVGMEVGSLREKIIVALLIYKFGEGNVETEIPVTEPEVDLKLYGQPVSIKTITRKGFAGVKLVWTVDTQKVREFRESYYPHCDILLVQINWDAEGGFYYLPLEVQRKVFREIGSERYIKLPKPGTNPRGIEIAKEALEALVTNNNSKVIEIFWQRTKIDYNPFKRWVDHWREE